MSLEDTTQYVKSKASLVFKLETWLWGLLGAVLGGVADNGLKLLLDSSHFNFHDGWPALRTCIFTGAVVNALLFIKKSPLPIPDGIDQWKKDVETKPQP